MWKLITDSLLKSGNQFLSGGLVLMVLGSLGMYAKNLPSKLWRYFINFFTVVVDVQSTDPSYNWLLFWLHRHPYTNKARRLSIKHIYSKQGVSQFLLVPAKGNHKFFHGWRFLWVSRSTEDKPTITGGNTDISEAIAPKELLTIRSVGRSKKPILSVIEEAQSFFESLDTDRMVINRYKWGSWRQVRKAKRPLESIMLPPEAEDLVDDIQRFIRTQDWYKQMGLPYRRGYLFYGPPGTGKSSSIEAIAGHLGLPLYLINLSTMGDSSLEEAFSEIASDCPCIVLMEDVDTVAPQRDVNPTHSKISLGTLLNVIDGVQAGDNIILVMTSNRPEVLDSALTRHGRVDRKIEFGMATEDQISRAVTRFIEHPTIEQYQEITQWPRPISMAEVQERLKQLVLSKT